MDTVPDAELAYLCMIGPKVTVTPVTVDPSILDTGSDGSVPPELDGIPLPEFPTREDIRSIVDVDAYIDGLAPPIPGYRVPLRSESLAALRERRTGDE